jgi:hypothetical protein
MEKWRDVVSPREIPLTPTLSQRGEGGGGQRSTSPGALLFLGAGLAAPSPLGEGRGEGNSVLKNQSDSQLGFIPKKFHSPY